ncbi:MAG: YceI family protein [Acidobacteriota bacterium]
MLSPLRHPVLLLAVLSLALCLAAFFTATAADARTELDERPTEELLVFTQARSGSALSDSFDADHLPRLREAAETLGLPLRVIDVADAGAPAAVHLTPLIVYQNARGRTVFEGRYVEHGKLEHFVRTRRILPPAEQTAAATDAPTLRLGRSTVAAPIKVTPLTGEPPAAGDHGEAFRPDDFLAAAERAVVDAFERFSRRPGTPIGAGDRSFYMDFYPYRDESGLLSVSAALYSQFHCLDPIAVWIDEPFSGPWAERDAVFAEAARTLEREVLRQIDESTLGDGFVPVPRPVPAPTWEELGLALPPAPADQPTVVADLPLQARWRLAPPEPGTPPRLTFHFPPPFERYLGEVGSVHAELRLTAGDDGTLRWDGASGWVEADTASVTMGESALDNEIQGKKLVVGEHPVARFTLDSVDPGATPVRWGHASQLTADGTFQMIGQTLDVPVRAEVEPVIDVDGEPALRVLASFEIRLLEPFGIKGPPGPAPAADTLRFHLDFLMQPDD